MTNKKHKRQAQRVASPASVVLIQSRFDALEYPREILLGRLGGGALLGEIVGERLVREGAAR